jgi:hypothetical protein
MGMSEDQVHALLGDPLRILVMSGGRHVRMIDIENGNQITSYPDLPEDADASVTHEIHYYTKAARGGSWYVRAVTFTPDALVSKITKTFYAD